MRDGVDVARKVLDQSESDQDCNEFVWVTCTAAGIAIQLGRMTEASALLESAREACASLEREGQEVEGILDTAATFHERLADLAQARGDASMVAAESKRAAAIRARIEASK